MRDYEVVYIFDSTLEREEIEERLDSFHSRLTGDGSGEITALEHWGKRQLAYPIQEQENGYYVVAQFRAEPSTLEEFERTLKLDEDLLRHLVVLSEGELPTPPSARGPDEEEEDEESEAEEEGEEEEESEGAAEAEDGTEEASDDEAEETSEDEAEEASDEDAEAEEGEERPSDEGAGDSGEAGEAAGAEEPVDDEDAPEDEAGEAEKED